MRPLLQVSRVPGRQRARLHELYQTTDCPRTRIRTQMVLLSLEGHSVAEIAHITRQSDDTVRRWLHRFVDHGWLGLQEGAHPGRPADLTPTMDHFLLNCLKQSPHKFGVPRPTWTTSTLAQVVAKRFGLQVSDECVRQHLQGLDMVCRRPTWTVKHLAAQQPGYAQKKAPLPGC